MKIKSGFVLEEVGGVYLAVAVGKRAEQFRVLIKLNSTGAFLWEQIAERDMTERELSEALIAKYGIDPDTAGRDTATFVHTLSEGGLLE